jgi:heparin binding hemagglutinin HbhA
MKESTMPVLDDITKNIDVTPVYAVVGVTDLAVEKAREAGVAAEKARTKARADFNARADKARADFAPEAVQARANKAAHQLLTLPTLAVSRATELGDKVVAGYGDLATRGKDLVARLQNQQATKDLVAQAETTISQAKGAVTTARKAAADVESSAKATITTGRHEATKLVSAVTGTVSKSADEIVEEVEASAKTTAAAAKRTNTTAKKAAKRTTSRAKAATTSAKKTTAAAKKATETGAEKVGD